MVKTIMSWSPATATSFLLALTVSAPLVAQARSYVSIEQAQRLLFGETVLTHAPVVLNDLTQKKMKQASSVSHRFDSSKIWRTHSGDWFVVDEVVGKHEMITYAVGILADGTLKGIEILEYRESYGYQVQSKEWRSQFVGKNSTADIKLNQDIHNISGATLSCKHLTDGVKRLLIMHDLVLKNR